MTDRSIHSLSHHGPVFNSPISSHNVILISLFFCFILLSQTPVTPVSAEAFMSLQDLIIQRDAHALDETSKQNLS
jgi:hypothetical protein